MPCGSFAAEAGADDEVHRWIVRHVDSLMDLSTGRVRLNSHKAAAFAAMMAVKNEGSIQVPPPRGLTLGLNCPNQKCRRRWTLRADTFQQIVLRASRAGLRRVPLP